MEKPIQYQTLVLLEDVKAADVGFDYALGLLHVKGSVLGNVLPHVAAKLIASGKAVSQEDFKKLGKGATSDKQARPQVENKSAPKSKKRSMTKNGLNYRSQRTD